MIKYKAYKQKDKSFSVYRITELSGNDKGLARYEFRGFYKTIKQAEKRLNIKDIKIDKH